MKLRQKLAVVLAATMVATAVPVVTMAASTNTLSRGALKVEKDTEFEDITTANAVRVVFNDFVDGEEVFYLDLDNAEWDKDVLAAAAANNAKFTEVEAGKEYTYAADNNVTVTYTRQDSDTMKITVSGLTRTGSQDPFVNIPLLVKAKDGDAKVSVTTKGGRTTVSEKKDLVFATTSDKKIAVSVDDDKAFYTKGTIGDITVEEAFKGAFKKETHFKIELADSDFQFTTGTITAEYKYGFSGKTATVKGEIDSKDKGILHVTLPAIEGDTRGTIILKDIEVKSTNKKPEEGDFLVDIKNDGSDDDLVEEKSNLKVAKVSNYSIAVKMDGDKAVDIKAGRKDEVKFDIEENIDDSMRTSGDFDLTLDNGHWDYKKLVDEAIADKAVTLAAGQDKDDLTDQEYQKLAAKIDEYWLANKITDNTGDWKTAKSEAKAKEDTNSKVVYAKASFDTDKDGYALPETITYTLGSDADGNLAQSNGDRDTLTIKTNVCVPINNKEKEKITLKVSGRGVENEVSTTAVNIVNPFNVTFEQAVLKTGLQSQVSGSFEIKETDKDCLQKGQINVRVVKDGEAFGIYLTDAKVEVSDGLKGTETTVRKGSAGKNATIDIDLRRVSKEAATISFKDLKFTTDRTVPEGTYDLEITGDAIDEDGWNPDTKHEYDENDHRLVIKDFIKISTSNTQDITANGLAKGKSTFVIGESKYTLNGETVEMDAPSYIQDPGYTMVPIRYVANAFGVAPKDILFGKGTVTLLAGERTISLTNGSKVAKVNGNDVTMAAPVVISKEGRIYAPASQIASLLGIKSEWDATSKTATFINE